MFKGTRQNGRTPGTQNKTTKEIRETFKNLLENNLGKFKTIWIHSSQKIEFCFF